MKFKTKLIVALFSASLLGGFIAYRLLSFGEVPGPGIGQEIEVEIPRGVGPKRLASILERAGIISNEMSFVVWLRLTGNFERVKSGSFVLRDNWTPKRIIATVEGRSASRGVQVTIPEGFTLTDTAKALETAGLKECENFVEVATSSKTVATLKAPGPTFEGYLFPDTYFFDATATSEDVIEKMYGRFQEQLGEIDIEESASIKEIAILASIVQAEARIIDEMPVIAGVYVNRLTKPEFPTRILQADPTVAYGCEPYIQPRAESCASFKGTLYRSHLTDATNPYNTYAHSGLPPGPICAPGLDALKAAADPADTPYFYFVAHKDGRHAFSATLKEHQKAVEKYRQLRKGS